MKADVWFSVALGVVLAGVLAGCTATVDVNKNKLGPRPVSCTQGSTIPCPCPDGSTATQTCNAFLRYDQCACPNPFGAAGMGM